MRFYRNEAIEIIARDRLAELEQILGKPLAPPIPIDLLAEKVLGLQFLWEEIDELPGEIIFGAIIPDKRLIVLNERRRKIFETKPGLERSTKGHEMGHWDLFVDRRSLHHPSLFAAQETRIAFRSSPVGDVAVMNVLSACPEGRELLRQIEKRADEPDEARCVNRYAAAISMPKNLICREALRVDRTKWSSLYRLRDQFDVTISALTVRLGQLDLLTIAPDGRLHESRDAARGQQSLIFPS